jgi:multidrug efflux pump
VRISETSVRRPVFATVISLLLVIFGLVSLERLPVREYPDIDRPVVSISTTYRGASADVVENKVTQIIEERIAGLEGILKIESDSADERSTIRIEFDISRDMDAAANDVRDRVGRLVASLPPEADPPEVSKADASAEPVMFLNFSAANMTPLEVTDYAERFLVDRLSTVPGVARVGVAGGRRPAMRIWIDRQALAARQMTVADIENALRRENTQLPAGRLESRAREFSLRTAVGLENEADFSALVIGRGPGEHLVRLGEVADVQLAPENERTAFRTNGRSGVGMWIEAQSRANTLDIVRGVRAEVARLNQDLPPGAALAINVDNGVAIESALREVLIAVLFAFGSVLVVIFAFLGSVRATLIPAITIPVSIIASFTVMYALGYSVNVLTLLGLVLAVGLVVDDAIVVLENIHKRAEAGEPPVLAAVTGSREIGFAVIATTLTLVAVFVPISFLPGDLGRLFREFGFTLAAAVIFSSLVALTLTPMLVSRWSAESVRKGRAAKGMERFFSRSTRLYERSLRGLIRRPGIVVAAVAVLLGLGALGFRTLPSEFAPSADIGRVFMLAEAPEGASFEYTSEYARRIEEIILAEMERHGDIQRVVTRIPGAWTAASVNTARFIIVLADWGERTRSSDEIRESLLGEVRKLPGVRVTSGRGGGLGMRGWGRPVQAVIGGPDYDQLAEWTETMLAAASANPGLVTPTSNFQQRQPQVRVSVDRNRAADLGISLQSVGRTLETVLGSRIVTTFIDRGREYNVILQGRADERATLTDLTNLHVRSERTGELIPLANVVQVQETAGAAQLSRFNRLRAVKIQSDLAAGYSMGEAVDWFREAVPRELPAGAALMWDGESAEFIRSGQQMYFTFLFALAIVFLVLAAQFESFIHPTVIMVTVPLALLGAVFGLMMFGLSVNIFSQIAVILLIGIAAKNGVLIVEFANQLRDRGVEFGEAVIGAATARLRPVVMTSLCTAFGALPFLLATGAGSEQRRPIGVVVFFGTLISVFLTLYAVPAVYSLIAKRTRSPQYMSRVVDSVMGRPAG